MAAIREGLIILDQEVMRVIVRIEAVPDIVREYVVSKDHIAGLERVDAIIVVVEEAVDDLAGHSCSEQAGIGRVIRIAPGDAVALTISRAKIAELCMTDI